MEKYPVKEDGIVYRNPNTLFRYNAWPTICRDDEGVLYTVFSGLRGQHVCPFGKTCLCKSYDNGKTWSAPLIVNDTWLDDRDAGILCLGGKKMMVSWFTHPAEHYVNAARGAIWVPSVSLMDELYPSIPEEHGKGGSFLRVSEDGGLTWGDTYTLPISAPHGPIQRRDGSLLYLGKELLAIWDDSIEGPDVILAMESRDDGKTWTELGKVPLPDVEGISWERHLHEPHVLELANGRLLGVIRGEWPRPTVYLTHSDDGGYTWSVPEALSIRGYPPYIMQHSSGAILITAGRRIPPYGQRVLVSYDGGDTWPDEYVLRDDAQNDDLGYPATVELPDKKLLTVYYQWYPGDTMPSILYTKWSL